MSVAIEQDRPMDVLLVEDSSGDVRLTQEAFRAANGTVRLHVARDGVEAMAFLRQEGVYTNAPRPDFILLDLNLPRMDGREVLAHIKEDEGLKIIPTVILTTSDAEADIAQSYHPLATCYLSKPVQFDAFERLVRDINPVLADRGQVACHAGRGAEEGNGRSMNSATATAAKEVLLVEDSPGDVRLTQEAFRDANVDVHLNVAIDGVEALAFLRKEGSYANAARPDVILLDLNLPKMDGREVLATIKADDDLKTIPTVILTTSEAEADIVRSYRLQANCYLCKPVQLDEFEALVKSINDFWLLKVRLPQRTSS